MRRAHEGVNLPLDPRLRHVPEQGLLLPEAEGQAPHYDRHGVHCEGVRRLPLLQRHVLVLATLPAQAINPLAVLHVRRHVHEGGNLREWLEGPLDLNELCADLLDLHSHLFEDIDGGHKRADAVHAAACDHGGSVDHVDTDKDSGEERGEACVVLNYGQGIVLLRVQAIDGLLVLVHDYGPHGKVRDQPVVLHRIRDLLHHAVLRVGLRLGDSHGLGFAQAEEDAQDRRADEEGHAAHGALGHDEDQGEEQLADDPDEREELHVAHVDDLLDVPDHRHLDLAKREGGAHLLVVVQVLAQQVRLQHLPDGAAEADVAHAVVREVDDEEGQDVDCRHDHGRLPPGARDEERVQHEAEAPVVVALVGLMALRPVLGEQHGVDHVELQPHRNEEVHALQLVKKDALDGLPLHLGVVQTELYVLEEEARARDLLLRARFEVFRILVCREEVVVNHLHPAGVKVLPELRTLRVLQIYLELEGCVPLVVVQDLHCDALHVFASFESQSP
mmetsp:Transcript_6403/g.19783  ORF Transcript_6403/g.19783 Transcript_6403/m.19783 type:complete len:502 (-) Transcript_6403:328-1833(-)